MQTDAQDQAKREPSSDNASLDDRQQAPKPRTGRLTPVACVGCQRRKSKCDGQRPSCSACRSRATICVYEVADGLSRTADLRQKNQLLSARVIELEQLVSRLRFQDDARAASTLARLRIGDDIRTILSQDGDGDLSMPEPGAKRLRRESVDSQSSPHAFSALSVSPNAPQAGASQQRREGWSGRAQPAHPPHNSQMSWLSPLWDRNGDQLHVRHGSETKRSPNATRVGGRGSHSKGSQENGPKHEGGVERFRKHPSNATEYAPQQNMAEEFEYRRKLTDYSSSKTGQKASDNWRKRTNMIFISPNVLEYTSIPLQHNAVNFGQTNRLEDIVIPIWAVLPRHEGDGHTLDSSYSDFLNQKREQLKSGEPLSSICGPHPMIEVLFNDDSFAHADQLSQWAARIAYSCKSTGVEQIVLFWAGWYLMRWLLMPNPETYESIPEWLRPTPCQLSIPHNISNDFVPWPLLRETLCQRPAMQQSLGWFVELNRTMSCNWPHDVDAGLYKDGDSGLLYLNPMLVEHVNDMDNWTVGPRFRAFVSNVDAFIRVKYDEE